MIYRVLKSFILENKTNRWTREGFVLDTEVEGIEGEALDNLKPVTIKIDRSDSRTGSQFVGLQDYFLSKALLTKQKLEEIGAS